MSKKEELIEFIHEELDAVYCYNCKHQEDCDDDYCHRKNIGWSVSDEVVNRIVEIAMREGD